MDVTTDPKHSTLQADTNSTLQNGSENPSKDCGCDAVSPAPVTDKIPTTSDLEKFGELPIQNAEGKTLTFREIYGDSSAERHLVIFIRHFFCGVCYLHPHPYPPSKRSELTTYLELP
jgi:hypothetical protein